DAEDDVDPELRALGHRAPDDRERDAGEHDLEEVAGRTGDLTEPVERLLPDGDHLVHRGEEAGVADEGAAVAEGEAEADGPVDERAEAEDEDVLAGDVAGVLHPREARLEEREACLHEHDEDGGDDHPDRARRDQQVPVLDGGGDHPTSTSSRRRPVRLCVTFSIGVVQTIPSPDSLPLRAAAAIAATTPSTLSSSTTKTRSAFGRKRDSKMRPRYSWVTPSWRPWPTASITVTPTWPVSSSTASITVSMRSRITTTSTFVMRSPPIVVRAAARHARPRASGRAAPARPPRGSRAPCGGRGWPRSRGRFRSRASRSRRARSRRRAPRGARGRSRGRVPPPRRRRC